MTSPSNGDGPVTAGGGATGPSCPGTLQGQVRLNSPPRAPSTNARHSVRVKLSTRPARCLLSRTSTPVGVVRTYTQLPSPLLCVDFIHAPLLSISSDTRISFLVDGEGRECGGGVGWNPQASGASQAHAEAVALGHLRQFLRLPVFLLRRTPKRER